MIKGLGVDIVEIERLEKVAERWGDLFLNRVFTQKELAYSQSKRYPFQHLAARFAAKEAVFKALGGQEPLNFKDIEILNDEAGRPHCHIRKCTTHIHLSISHSKNYAVASAIFQEKV